MRRSTAHRSVAASRGRLHRVAVPHRRSGDRCSEWCRRRHVGGAVAFELTLPSLLESRSRALAIGLAAGALMYYVIDQTVERRARCLGGTGARIVVGVFLDGILESVAIGVSAVGRNPLSVAFVFRNATSDVIALVQTFASGAVLTLLATAMIPGAYGKAEPRLSAGLWFVLGFAIATLLALAEI